ncbi:hypothetical protein MTR_3g068195 [Medicago truncatula]|uniref:Endonuclease/exonuclease/phosphatase family protein n=1 Tax=Medicago truncatula TaxID=3880 RepID=A0A072UYW6_MEDTR|nr:hypothetical protein MTR_3g068195 [Medicago truncatula]
MEERRDRGVSSRHDDCNIFNKFIEDGRLVDLPICGRLFTWYRGDGFTMSRLDRYLLSENWCSTSPNCIQVANQRGLSDHVPFVLTVDNANWGPRPLRMLKCWADFPGYAQFVRDTWGSFNINGWGGFVLKEKLKLIKGKCNLARERMAHLDTKGETSVISEHEVLELRDLSVSLHSMSRIHTSVCWQQARLKWLQEGDANTKFFNGVMSARRRHNYIQLLQVNDVRVGGVQDVREAVFNQFSSHYKASNLERPGVESLRFRRLTVSESARGLKVNFNKSLLTCVNVSDSWLHEAALVLNCWVGSFPFVYLGLPIEGDPRRLDFWNPILNTITSRLSSWKCQCLSSDPLEICHVFAFDLLSFLLQGPRREEGGLGVRKLREFNVALLGKWCRRMLVDKEGLWYRVLKARYGEEGGGYGKEWLGIDGGAWRWRRRLFAWEEETVSECASLLHNVVLQENIVDRWRWSLDPIHGYSVKVAYGYLSTTTVPDSHGVIEGVWHKQVPIKVHFFHGSSVRYGAFSSVWSLSRVTESNLFLSDGDLAC